MPDTCMADTDILWDMEAMADTAQEDTEVMEAMVLVMAVDTDIAALVTMEDMVDTLLDTEAMVLDTGATVTTTVRDLLMPNLKLTPDICMADTAMEAMDMAVSGDKHSQVVQPTSSRNCQTTIKPKNCSKISQPLIQYQCLTFVKSRIYRESKSIYCVP